MKLSRFLIMLFLLVTAGKVFADNLTIESVTMKAGETKQVAINLTNPDKQYAAFQFDLVLPDGITVATNSKGKPTASLNEKRIEDHTLTVSDKGDNTYTLIAYSMNNEEFSGKSGALVYVTLAADKNVSSGKKKISLKSQVLTEASGKQSKLSDASFDLQIDEDAPVVTNDKLTIESVTMKAGETKQVAINLTNPDKQYAAFQFDLVLPDGITVAANSKGKPTASLNEKRIEDHTLTVSDKGNNTYTLIAYSMNNEEFSGKSGALVYVTLVADKNLSAGKKKISLKSQVFTDANGKQSKLTDASFDLQVAAPDPVTVTVKSATRVYGDANPKFEYSVEGGTLTKLLSPRVA